MLGDSLHDRDITSGFQTEIEAQTLTPILLFKGEFDSGDLNFWTGYGDLVWGGDTYNGSGDLIKIASVEETSQLQANNVTFELSGIKQSILSIILSEQIQGRPVSCWFGVLDSSLAVVADPYMIFKGKVDVATERISDDGTEATVLLSCESDLIE